jgi:hypothetical protein
MNILDMMNKLTALSQPVTEATKVTKTGKVHTAEPGGYGRKDDEDDAGNNVKKDAPKQGRGRPRKDADSEGNVTKPDWSAFGAKKDVKLPAWDKKKTTKHSLKDWIENLDDALNEAIPPMPGGQLSATPLPGATAIKNAQGQQVATATTPQAAAMMTKGDVTLTDPTKKIGEEKNYMGETEYHGYYKWRVACRKAGAVEFVGDKDIDEGHDASGKAVGEWDGVSGSVYGDAHKVRPAGEMTEAKKAKPDFLDVDKDKNKKEPFKKAVKDAEKNPVEEAKKPSAGMTAKEKSSTVKAAKAGKDIGKPGKNFEKVASKAAKTYGSKEKGEKVAAAAMWKNKAKSVSESKMSELDIDIKSGEKEMPDASFKKKYGKTKSEMKASMAKKPVSKIKESILRESQETLQHIINRFKNEAKRFVAGEDLDEDLYDALYDYYCDQGEMPYGTMKARDGDPYEWVTQRFDRDVQDHDVPVEEEVRPENIPAFMRKQRGDAPLTPKQVLAPRADSISDPANLRAANGTLDRNPFGASPTGDIQFENWAKDLDNLLNEGLNVVANTGLGDGPDSVTISATDEDAQKLLAIVKSAGLGMFAGDEHQEGDSPQMSVQGQNNPEADIDVVNDHDGMLGLIRKMTGQGSGSAPGAMEVEVDEEETPDQAEEMAAENNPTFGEVEPDQEGSSDEEVQQATNKLEKVHDVWSQAGSDVGEESSEGEEESAEDEGEEEESAEGEEDSAEDSEEELDEAYANDADATFESDIDFMQNVISGGLNGKKRTQSVGGPVTIASTPMKESTDLLKEWKKLAGF